MLCYNFRCFVAKSVFSPFSRFISEKNADPQILPVYKNDKNDDVLQQIFADTDSVESEFEGFEIE